MSHYFHDAIPLYLERMVDWDVYVRQMRGDGADPDADREAYQEVLRTCESRANERDFRRKFREGAFR